MASKSLFSSAFWADAAERTIATAAQSGLAVLVTFGGIAAVDWAQLGSIVGLAALVALLKSVVASSIGDGSASLVSSTAKHAA